MSRRDRMPKQPSALPGQMSIRVVCTDRGQHPENGFGRVTVWLTATKGGGWRANMHGLRVTEYNDVDGSVSKRPPPLQKTYPLRCRRCRRNVPLRADTLARLCFALADAGQYRLDISAIGPML